MNYHRQSSINGGREGRVGGVGHGQPGRATNLTATGGMQGEGQVSGHGEQSGHDVTATSGMQGEWARLRAAEAALLRCAPDQGLRS